MAIEDEYELTFTNRQVREEDGWRMNHMQVRNIDEDSFYIVDRQMTTPAPRSTTITDTWTPNSMGVYADDYNYDTRFRRFRHAPLS
jgi:hypothetical protein